jgi:glyoxylase-like metal-dependent hydrolase (beta-lactamase superfamily II)
MQVKITLLDLGDADAIIVHLTKTTGEQLVVLIDAGNVRDGQKCIDKLDPILKSVDKKAPDLIVCTHYDADHIRGLIKIIARYGNDIGKIWSHHPGILQQAAMVSEIVPFISA